MIDLYPKSISKATGSTQTPQAAETGPPPSPGFMTESEKISQENYFDFDFVVFFFTQYDGNIIIIILTSSDARIKCETSYRVDIPTIQNKTKVKAALCSLREFIYNINDVIMQSQKICIFFWSWNSGRVHHKQYKLCCACRSVCLFKSLFI